MKSVAQSPAVVPIPTDLAFHGPAAYICHVFERAASRATLLLPIAIFEIYKSFASSSTQGLVFQDRSRVAAMLDSIASHFLKAVVLILPWRSTLSKTKELHKSISVHGFVLIIASQAASVGVVMAVEAIKEVFVGLFNLIQRTSTNDSDP